jgi:hypothetical protein
MRTYASPAPPAAGYLSDVYLFSAAANTWTALSLSGSGPSSRVGMGFEATPDGMLYVFGGTGGSGGNRTGIGGWLVSWAELSIGAALMGAHTHIYIYIVTGFLGDFYRLSVASSSWTQCGAWEVGYVALAISIQHEPRDS